MAIGKKRWTYLLLVLITIALGLASRAYAVYLPNLVAEYAGDILYASCMFFVIRFISIKGQLLKIALISYLICVCIETLQLYQAPWIQKIRFTPPFGYFLGYGFLWSDMICYLVGVTIGYGSSRLIERE